MYNDSFEADLSNKLKKLELCSSRSKPNILKSSDPIAKKNSSQTQKKPQSDFLSHRWPRSKNQIFKRPETGKKNYSSRIRSRKKSPESSVKDPETDISITTPHISSIFPKTHHTKSIKELNKKLEKNPKTQFFSTSIQKKKNFFHPKSYQKSISSTSFNSLMIDQKSINSIFLTHAKKNEVQLAMNLLKGAKFKYRAEVDCKDRENWGAIHHAAMNKNSEFVEEILEYGGDVNLKGKGGLTAFFLACLV